MSVSDQQPGEAPPAETNAGEPTAAETKVPMQFTAAFWRFTVQMNRAGREEGSAIDLPGKLVAQVPGAGEKAWPAVVNILKKDPKLRLDLRIFPDRAEITVPLEDFALDRLTDKLKEFISGYGMALQIGFSAEDHDGRQLLEAVDFAFSSEKPDG
jgi:hypothetical protein